MVVDKAGARRRPPPRALRWVVARGTLARAIIAKPLRAKANHDRLQTAPTRVGGVLKGEGRLLQPVRLVLLLLDGPREGENDFLEFPSLEDAIAYGRELFGERRFQLEGIEDGRGRSIIAYDHLNELCRPPEAQRRYG